MKNVLIIGSTSTVGLALGNLLAKNYRVFYGGRKDADYYLDLYAVDLKFPENQRFDVVIHTAADFGGNGEDDMCRAEMVNAIGTFNMCRLAKKVQAKHTVIVSSLSAFYMPGDPNFNIYSLSKRHGDELAQLYCEQFKMPLTILRPTQLYDAESRCKSHQRLFYSIIDKASKGEDINFYGANDALRNYLFLDDFCEIIANVLEQNIVGLFNCPASKSVRLTEVAKTAYQVFNQAGTIHFLAEKPNIVDLPDMSGSNLYNKICFEPKISLAEGIKLIKRAREAT